MYSIQEDLTNLYNQLIIDFASIGICNEDDYHFTLKARTYFPKFNKFIEIEKDFLQKWLSVIPKYISDFKNINGIAVVADNKGCSIPISYCKKLAVFSQSTLTISDKIEYKEESPHDTEIDGAPDLTNLINNLYGTNSRFIHNGIILPVPKQIEYFNAEKFTDCMKNHEVKLTNSIIKYQHKKGVNLDWAEVNEYVENEISPRWYDEIENKFRKNYNLDPHIFHLSLKNMENAFKTDTVKFGLLLPSLENLPVSTALRLRQDYKIEFHRFQKALKKMVINFKNEPDESRFSHILEEIEDEINLLNRSFSEIKNVHRKLAIPIGLIAVVFFFSGISPEFAKHLYAMFSGLATATFYEIFRNIKDVKNQVEKSPLYFPLLLMQSVKKDNLIL